MKKTNTKNTQPKTAIFDIHVTRTDWNSQVVMLDDPGIDSGHLPADATHQALQAGARMTNYNLRMVSLYSSSRVEKFRRLLQAEF